MVRGYRRNRSIVRRPVPGRSELQWVNNGGRDAPVDAQSNRLAISLIVGTAIVGTLVIVLAVLNK